MVAQVLVEGLILGILLMGIAHLNSERCSWNGVSLSSECERPLRRAGTDNP